VFIALFGAVGAAAVVILIISGVKAANRRLRCPSCSANLVITDQEFWHGKGCGGCYIHATCSGCGKCWSNLTGTWEPRGI